MSHSSNSEEVSCLAAEMRAINQSHTQLLEQNQKLMESNSEIMKQVLQLSKDLQDIKLQLTKALNQPPVTPAPSAPANQVITGTPSSAASQDTSSPQLPQQSPQQPQQQTHQLASRQSGSITSGLPSKSSGVVPPAMFSPGAPSPSATARPTPAAPAQVPSRGFISTPERGIENITPPVSAAGPSSFAGTPTKPLGSANPKVSLQLQGMVKQDTTDRQRLAMMATTAPPARNSLTTGGGSPATAAQLKTQFSGVTHGASSATSKPSQAFGKFSFSSSTVKPAPSFGKPATNSQSPFAGFSFGMSNTSTASTSTISAAGVFKPAVSSKTTGGSAGGSPVVFGKPDLTQDSRTTTPGYAGFYASPKALPGASPQAHQIPSTAATQSKTQSSRVTPGASSATSKPSQVFGNFSFSSNTVKPAPSFGKPATNSQSPFGGFSFGMSNTSTPSTSTISAAGVFKPAVSSKTTGGSAGGSPVVFGKPDLTQESRTTTPGYPGFYASPKALPGASPQAHQIPSTAATQSKTQFSRVTPGASSTTSKPSQVFGNFSFSSNTVKPAPSFGKPATNSKSPFGGFSFGMSNTSTPSTSTISAAGVLKPAVSSQTTGGSAGGSPVVFGKPDLTQDSRSSSPGCPGFYASPKALPGASPQADQTVPSSRKPGMSLLAKDTLQPSTGGSTGGSPVVFGKPDLSQDLRSSSPGHPEFYSSPKALPRASAQADQTVPSLRKPGQSLLAKDTLQPSTGGSPVVFGTPDLSQDSRSSSPGHPEFYSSPKTLSGASPQADQTVPSSRKPGQSPLAKDFASIKAVDTPKSVPFKAEVEDDDVIFISMTQPSPEQRARAEKLVLPGGFYFYEDTPPCKGCIGCIEDLDIDSLYQTGGDGKASAPAVRPKEPTSSRATGGSSASFGSLSINPPGGSLFGGGDTGGGISFASLAANHSEGFEQPFGKKASDKPFAFANAGAPVFGASASRDNDENDDSHGGDDEYDPHYEPIITLPDIGSISTGEEDEEEMFRHRAKLFRYDRDSKAWKERGVGDIKILRNPKTGGARIVMRRDQILKLCANHLITPDMVLKPMMASETAWVWFAVDFSEEEAKNEQLAVKFKHVEDAKGFKEAFLEAQKLLQFKEEDSKDQKEKEEKKKEEKENRKLSDATFKVRPRFSLSSQLPAPTNDNTQNLKKDTPAVEAPSTGFAFDRAATTMAVPSASSGSSTTPGSTVVKATFSFSTYTSQFSRSDKNKPKSDAGFSLGFSSMKPARGESKDSNNFSSVHKPAHTFNVPPEYRGSSFTFHMDLNTVMARSPGKPSETQSPMVGRSLKTSFPRRAGMLSGGFVDQKVEQEENFEPIFQMPKDYKVSTDSKSEEPVIRSSDPNLSSALAEAMKSSSESGTASSKVQPNSTSEEPVIRSSVPNLSSTRADAIKSSAKSDTASSTVQAIGREVNPEEERNIHFQPIVKLPEKVDIVTGEEQEVAEFVERGKLYRFDEGAKHWKERGVGDIKIMKDENRDVYRIFMIRDQIYKVCANHYIMSCMVLHPMSGSDRAWVWRAMDAADGEPTSEQLAVKFKEPSIATAFKEKFEEAQAKIRLREAASGDDIQKGSQEDGDATASGTASSFTGQKGDGVATATPSSQDSTSKERMIRSRVPNLSSALADAIKSSAESDAASSTVQAIGGEVNPEEERDIHFQPIVRLPEKVDLVTGEEQEVAEFVGRGKLYRFDGGAKHWKERGVGDIKIMKDENRDVYRIVMRRDQIHKVCANHYIMSSMVLHPMSGSDRAWVWHAMDTANGEPTSEQLAIKFKESSIATAFKEKFEEAQAKIRLREAGNSQK